jgi:uncharacterized protein (TIGR03067 family)
LLLSSDTQARLNVLHQQEHRERVGAERLEAVALVESLRLLIVGVDHDGAAADDVRRGDGAGARRGLLIVSTSKRRPVVNYSCLLLASTIVTIGDVASVAAHSGVATADKRDLTLEEKRLQGLWRVDVLEIDGSRMTAQHIKQGSSDLFELRWLFTATKAKKVVDLTDITSALDFAQYKLNVRAGPKLIDLQLGDRVLKGIYLLDDKTIKVCFSARTSEGRDLVPGKEARPTDFVTRAGSERILLIFVRDRMPNKK